MYHFDCLVQNIQFNSAQNNKQTFEFKSNANRSETSYGIKKIEEKINFSLNYQLNLIL